VKILLGNSDVQKALMNIIEEPTTIDQIVAVAIKVHGTNKLLQTLLTTVSNDPKLGNDIAELTKDCAMKKLVGQLVEKVQKYTGTDRKCVRM